MGYMVQPVLEPLGTFSPDAEHPLLVAVADAIAATGPTIGIDAPISNWCWSDNELTLLDVGLPMMWDDEGQARLDVHAFSAAFPAPIRAMVVKQIKDMLDRYRTPRNTAVEFVGRLPMFGLQAWCEPAAQALNRRLELSSPITLAEAEALVAADTKTLPRIKRMQRVQRTWERRVRRRRYEYFIGDSTY